MPAVEDFLKTVLRSGILDRAQLQQALGGLPAEGRDDPQRVAEHLIKSGKLSRFQARKLLKGVALGLVLGPFQVLAPIGRGASGTVYLARDTRSQHLLALKVLPPKRAREQERVLARFRREMEMIGRVAHPSIPMLYEVGICSQVHYIAMEYIPGQSLHRLVSKEGPLAVPRAARIFAEVASALDHAHNQGLVHRDLKPSNILITPHDHAKLLDLGLALWEGERGGDRSVIGGAGYVVGTMDYISPEQAVDPSRVDSRSDLYGLGCTLFFTLTGRPPFPAGTSKEKIQRHIRDEPPLVTEFNSAVSPAFAAIVRKLMAKKPRERYPTAAVLREELVMWSAGEVALPLDRPEDEGYQEAVAQLEAADLPETDSSLAIPVGLGEGDIPLAIPAGTPVAIPIPEEPTKQLGRTDSVVLSLTESAPAAANPNRLLYLSIGAAALVFLGCLGFIGLLSLFARR
jgi:serine/threonine protein kinase